MGDRLGPDRVISPEVVLTNRDVARATRARSTNQSKREWESCFRRSALKMARLAKSHFGATCCDTRWQGFLVFPIVKEYTNGRALIPATLPKKSRIDREGDHDEVIAYAWRPAGDMQHEALSRV